MHLHTHTRSIYIYTIIYIYDMLYTMLVKQCHKSAIWIAGIVMGCNVFFSTMGMQAAESK
jgi:hypothetical protein